MDLQGQALGAGDELQRVRALAIPPAWNDVWICPWPNGHLQAVGTDGAGRRQYLYHEQWRRQQDSKKHDRVLGLASSLPRARRVVKDALGADGLESERVLAAAFRLLDLVSIRVGSEAYARANDTYGLATLRRRHVAIEGRTVTLHYRAKGSQLVESRIVDRMLARVLGDLLDRDDAGPRLLAWWDGEHWHQVRSTDINDYLQQLLGGTFTAKDFRTWNATVLMAQALSLAAPAESSTERRRAVTNAYRAVADYLDDTVAVVRSSYVDPRVVDRYLDGAVLPSRALPRSRRFLPVHAASERAVLRLLTQG